MLRVEKSKVESRKFKVHLDRLDVTIVSSRRCAEFVKVSEAYREHLSKSNIESRKFQFYHDRLDVARQKVLLLVLLCFSFSSFSQDLSYTKKVIKTLCSPSMFGRGYLKNGNRLAADYISSEFKNSGLLFFNDSCFQKFSYSVNTFPKTPTISVNGKKLNLADDYYVMAKSASCKGTFKVVYYTLETLKNNDSLMKFIRSNYSDYFILIDRSGTKNKDTLEMLDLMKTNPKNAKGLIMIDDKPYWNVSVKAENYSVISLKRSSVKKKITTITVDIENKFIPNFSTQNVVAYIKGSEKPDSFIVFTAHYDHLGGMGNKTYFPGANDNASGVSMLLNLAKHFKEHPSKLTVVFIAFSGEEAGLLGSTYFAAHPWFAIEKIKVLLNLDMIGTGDDGIMLVNGAIFSDLFNRFVDINNKKKYVKKIDKRGEAKNSDHYPFYAKGVKCFFIYTQGGVAEYHNPRDKAKTLPLTKYKELFHLICDFSDTF